MKDLGALKENLKKFFNAIMVDENPDLIPSQIDLSFASKKNLLINLIFEKDSFLTKQDQIKKDAQEFFELNDVFEEFDIEEFSIIFSKKRFAPPDSSSQKKTQTNSPNTKKNTKQISGIKKIILVASGKGGVGKSTFASNLALKLSQIGWSVGLLDADIYGASIPLIFGLEKEIVKSDENGSRIIPISFKENLKINSIAFIVRSDEAIIWRGPMISKALDQILNQTNWGELDFLIVDTPPGTGDIHISLLENHLIDSVFLISTSHITSLANTQKTFSMFSKFQISNESVYSVLNMLLKKDCLQENPSSEILDFQFIQNSKSIFKIPRIENFSGSFFCDQQNHLMDKISRKIIKDLFRI
jgi:Mrp family chromosome partitioning ATPase